MENRLLKKMISVSLSIGMVGIILLFFGISKVDAAIKITPGKNTLIVGESVKIKVSGTKKKVKWSSSKVSVAKVSKKGKVKALKKGTAIIKAKVDSKTIRCKIKVEKPTLSKHQIWSVPGKNLKVILKGNSQTVTWDSDNEEVATITDGVVTTVAKGNTTICARIGKKTYKCKVYVSDTDMNETIENIEGVIEIVNKIREENGMDKLSPDYNLCMAAMERANEITTKFEHIRPDGTSCFTILKKYGYKVFSFRGENIAYGFTTPQKVVQGWMNSQGHKERILDPNYEKTGVGYYFDEATETCYWVQIFYTK